MTKYSSSGIYFDRNRLRPGLGETEKRLGQASDNYFALAFEGFFGTYDVAGTDVSSASSVGAPALTVHVLGATGVSSATSTGTPAISQSHVLVATGVGSSPAVEAPELGQIYNLVASDAESLSAVENPTLYVPYDLQAGDAVAASGVGNPVLGQVIVLPEGMQELMLPARRQGAIYDFGMGEIELRQEVECGHLVEERFKVEGLDVKVRRDPGVYVKAVRI